MQPATTSTGEGSGGDAVPKHEPVILERTLDDMNDLLARAKGGDRSVIPALRLYLDSHPRLWHQLGDLAFQTQVALVEAVAGKSEIVHEAILGRMTGLKHELLGPAPTALERLLVDRIIIGGLQVHHADAAYSRHAGSLSLGMSDCLRRRL